LPKILNINSYSLNIKVIFSLFILACFLLCILFLLEIPKMHKEQHDYTKKQIEQIITLTKEQIKIANKAIFIQKKLEKNINNLEEDIKTSLQKSFNLTYNIHKGKIYLLYLNQKYINEEDTALYTNDKTLQDKKYKISNISNVKNIYTGNLSAKQIIDASKSKKPIFHILNNKKAITWVREISKDKDILLFIITAYENDFNKNIDSTFWKILPASLISLFLTIIAGFYLFKKLLKGISILDKKVVLKTSELKSSLKQKDILLKEIHHRVKNNLSLTISLIKLQQAKIKDKNTKKVLNSIQERIYTMELVHRRLYESKDLDLIEIKPYVEILVNEISKTYQDTKKVELILDIHNIYLDIEKTIQLITNSFKYAFNQEEDYKNTSDKLYISMKEENSFYILEIKDNGKGIDSSINIYQNKTLGLKLINNITTLQLAGSFEYTYENGALFKIKFPMS